MDGSQQKEQRRFRLGPVGGVPHYSGSPRRLSPSLSLANDTYFSPAHKKDYLPP